jgi:hypothetical protein
VLGYIDVGEGQSTVLEISAVTVPIEPQEY